VAVVAERRTDGLGVPVVLVPNTRRALAVAADYFYGHPSRSLRIVGVTGTNGKTTTTHWIRAIFEAAGCPTGLLGTLGYRIGSRSIPAPNTTPESPDLQRLLSDMRQGGLSHVAMEVSSHGIALHRIDQTAFDVGVFTNLTRDHLDFHQTIDAYLEAKRRFFLLLQDSPKPDRYIVANRDDSATPHLLAGLSLPVITFGMDERSDVYPVRTDLGLGHSRVTLRTPDGDLDALLCLPGRTNLYNALAAAAVAWRERFTPEQVARGLASLEGVPGRFETLRSVRGFSVVIDYAHTPDGLERLLRSVRELTPGRVISVFGCGGDRDQGKRPQMGAISVRLADHTIVTSDNPRREDPADIISDIMAGTAGESVEAIADRRQAIAGALALARRGDSVVIAGKGHEDYQIVGEQRIPLDDRVVVRELLRSEEQGT
jgi:UDP-N-acetylmuramoyl-L-alanyl-D-glutamate--2,6-diaminopimelate ligase